MERKENKIINRDIRFKRVFYVNEDMKDYHCVTEWGIIASDHYVSPQYYGNSAPHFKDLQLTGFKDKKGRVIWEGDILKDMFGNLSVIEFYNGGFCFYTKLINSYCACFETELYEVVGNFYENPELLEQKQ